MPKIHLTAPVATLSGRAAKTDKIVLRPPLTSLNLLPLTPLDPLDPLDLLDHPPPKKKALPFWQTQNAIVALAWKLHIL